MRNNEVIEGLSRRSGIPKKNHSKLLHSGDERCHDCGKALPTGKGQKAFYCRTIGLCRYCYGHKYPIRRNLKQIPVKPNGKRFLSWSERRYLERAGFNPEVWSPEFRREMEDYWRARMRGEV